MTSLLIAFLVSTLTTLLIIRYQHLHAHLSSDHQNGPQKFHSKQTPRVGGIGIFLALIIAALYHFFTNVPEYPIKFWVLLCCLPVFNIGLTEDITKKIGVKLRLFFTALGAALAIWLLKISITSIDIPGIDYLLGITIISSCFTVLAITGLANAYNIIDGFNGLASMVAIVTLLAIAYVGLKVADLTIVSMALVLVGAIAGFFIWNYPRGLIFLGDGGAYLIGFYIAILSILLVQRHHEVSPWFALLINAYPIFETLFTIWRRKVHQGKNPGLPDGAHFHSIIYRRIIRWAEVSNENNTSFSRNARTSPYLWLLSTLAIFPAVLWWNYTWVLEGFALIFCITYVWLYRALVKFKTPSWLK